jgi:hypothetical protein
VRRGVLEGVDGGAFGAEILVIGAECRHAVRFESFEEAALARDVLVTPVLSSIAANTLST